MSHLFWSVVLMACCVALAPSANAQSLSVFDPYASAVQQNETKILSIPALKAAIAHQGYSKVTDVIMSPATGIVQASARNPQGLVTNLQVDPTTGEILSALTAH